MTELSRRNNRMDVALASFADKEGFTKSKEARYISPRPRLDLREEDLHVVQFCSI